MPNDTIRRMFADDLLCLRCGFWYTPDVLDDETGVCASCQREKSKSQRVKFVISTLDSVFWKMRSEFPDSDEPPFVYFILAKQTRKVKVGFTGGNPYHRLRDLQVGSPDLLELLGVIAAPFDFEQLLHRVLNPYHSHGEWFESFKNLIIWIKRTACMPSQRQ